MMKNVNRPHTLALATSLSLGLRAGRGPKKLGRIKRLPGHENVASHLIAGDDGNHETLPRRL